MNSNLLVAASKVIPLTELLVNVVSRRVRQLNQGHRPLVATPPGMGIADVALTEIIEGKLTSKPAEKSDAVVETFPGLLPGMKKAA
ncbi:MAG: DNA-directed RNA polymerase subunit omega [Verrucomicrobiota bacterium]|nr:DNA-directed RNA polymerase subunit omega [Chthoniobacterales bacterium]MDQ3115354.1 DNA-directed RNA polymerase subunit omega [Verrucomicrobiota bacterium]MDQ3545685.1 DNA-directed RNA polymerase subunit omega [Verrucomicrobiota bacterium]